MNPKTKMIKIENSKLRNDYRCNKSCLIKLLILPHNLKQLLIEYMSKDTKRITFVYNGTQYDATAYSEKHPGGKPFIENMNAERKDFTEYFKSLHSDQAEKILKSFPIVSEGKPSADSQRYMKILQTVSHLYKPRWQIQILLLVLITSSFLTACFTSIPVLSVVCFGLVQTIAGWMGHSMSHSRDLLLQKVGRVFAALVGGFCLDWWAPKHNMHHMFTNSQLYDDDIKHDYKVYLYPFLYLKWRFDSFVAAISTKNVLDTVLISLNYALLIYCRSNLVYFLIGELIAGFFSANVLIGNHEREKRYPEKIEASFIEHQIITCRNYRETNWAWVILMGGMQFQTEHHLFPQIPFYNLPKAVPIIKEELGKINKSIIYGPVL